jgi:hexosaminidase
MPSHLRPLPIFILGIFFLSACNLHNNVPIPSETSTRAITRTSTLTDTPSPPTATSQPTSSFSFKSLVPKPVSAIQMSGTFYLTPGMRILVEPETQETRSVGQFLADLVNPATGYGIQVDASGTTSLRGNIILIMNSLNPSLGEEGYQLTITPEFVKVSANHPAGLFYGVQTLRQLIPPAIESNQPQSGPWVVATGMITDYPRFTWRGAMLDVARHFFTVHEVERYIDLLALYKINRLHLHLTDDQGWRIEIKSWPNLTTIGGSTQVGGGPGGYYTQDEFIQIVTYAQNRYITVIPEIDMPGHVTAALAAYSILNCSGIAPVIPTDIHVLYSTLCISSNSSLQFMQDVLHELAGLTPGPFIHIGGDEAGATSASDYITFMQSAQAAVQAEGKRVIGWGEIAPIKLSPDSIVQFWNSEDDNIGLATRQGNQLVLSPASKVYLNAQYDPSTPLGEHLDGYLNIETAYKWDPLTIIKGLTEKEILGIEAPLWTETLQSMSDLEFMAFPRILGIAEIGWTPQTERAWEDYRLRLGDQGPRLTELGVNFFRSPDIPWK